MKVKGKTFVFLHVVEILYSIVVFAWALSPIFINRQSASSGMPVHAFNLPFHAFDGAARSTPSLVIWSIVVFLPLVIALFKIAAIFLVEVIPALADPRKPLADFLSVLESALVIAAIIAYIIESARVQSFFTASSPILYVFFVLSIAFNAFFVFMLITSFDTKDESYREYQRYKFANGQRKGVTELLFQPGIQKRLVFSFVPVILIIIVVLSFILMTDFSNTILGSVIDNGKLLADRTSTIIKANPADKIAAEDYLLIESKKNGSSAFPFKVINYYSRNPKNSSFAIAASTDKSLVGSPSFEKVEAFLDPTYNYNEGTKEYEFLAPVNLGKAYLGYVKVDYARDVIFEPYFRTQVKVVSIAAIFIYLSIFLTYLIGRTIVYPILYLRMSVATIAKSLSGMIKGENRISAELLQYTDRVETNDEIKGLSSEVGNMTAVIRGIVPYISASTLKNSEREKPMTESRDLCFLFTDIRGFTTLCEGMTPENVVEMLNHYLDIQSSIIIANHGDVDKFVGDEVMAMFEGPNKELNAVKTSLEIRKVMASEKEKAIAEKKNVVSIGIGINSGPVVFGSVGAKDRMDFTSIGDTVNLAARLEGANKAYGTKTLVTDAVHEKVKEEYLCREVDRLTVKGKKLPVSVYEIIQSRNAAGANMLDLCSSFAEALAFYRTQKWAKAEKVFKQLVAKYSDDASSTFLGRIELFKTNPPPADWDGVFNMTIK
jgi:class 3 adenylate cyclase